jgi:predicted PurR-regulated permease PerM
MTMTTTLQRHIWFWSIGLLLFFGLLWLLKGVLLPFIIGLAVAYFLDPVTRWLVKKGFSRTVSASIVLLSFVAVFVLIGMLTFPILQVQFIAFAQTLPGYVEQMHKMAIPWIEKIQAQLSSTPPEDLREQASSVAATAFGWATGAIRKIWDSGMALFDLISILFIAPVVSFYMLRDWPVMVQKIDSWLPRHHAKTIRKLIQQMDDALSGFVRGQALVCVVLGAIYALALTIAGLNFGLFIGFMAGILSFIPYVGSLIGLATGLIVAWFQYDGALMPIAIVAGIFGVGQFVEGNFLTPRLVGEKVGLHALWILFALMAGGALLGFTGVMVAVPVAAVTGVLVRFALQEYLQSSYYTGKETAAAKTAGKKA